MPPSSIEEYQVGWVCALPDEMAAARAMLDEEHTPFKNNNERDNNSYVLGRVGEHNVVIACLPAGVYGTNAAATVGNNLLRTFTGIRFGLMVGIGGAIPNVEKEVDIRLGDVVVSKPDKTHGGVIQYDLGKNLGEGNFECKGFLRPPPTVLLTALSNLQSQHNLDGSQIPKILAEMIKRRPNLAKSGYGYPGLEKDSLFCSHLESLTGNSRCTRCQDGKIQREARDNQHPVIHYGVIASGNKLIKNAAERDRLGEALGAKCVEMEAAGLMNEFPCIVIRGICDYADAHKNDVWQKYAATTAAAFAKELLSVVRPTEVAGTKHATDVMRYDFGLNINDAPEMGSNLFVGREKDLERLNDILSPESTLSNRRVAILGGLGGMGKTQLAITYAKQRRTCYKSVFWLNASSKAMLQQSLRSVAIRIGILSVRDHDFDDDQLCTQVSAWLSKPDNTRWLLIFDNYDEPESYDINRYFPYAWQGSIIITTRSPKKLSGTVILIQKLDQNESIQILKRRSERNNAEYDSGIQALASRLDGLPLALATAGAFLKRSPLSFQEYLDKYNEKWDILRQTAKNLPEYQNRTLFITWDLSFEQVQRQDRHRPTDAASLLRLLAYFDHQDVWYGLLRAGTGPDRPTWFVDLVTDQLMFEDAMHTLTDFCLVEAHIATKSYSLHACVHDWTLSSLNRVIDVELYKLAFRCVRKSIKTKTADHLAFIQNRRLVPHAVRLDDSHFRILVDGGEWVQENHYDLFAVALLLHNQHKFLPAEHMYGRALQGREQALGPENTLTLETVHNLGLLYMDQGKIAEAEGMYVRALQGFEKALGSEHISTLHTVDNLGLLYRDQGKMTEAEEMSVRALQGFEKALGSEHISTLNTVNSLGILYQDQGKIAEAEEMFVRALQGFEKTFGPESTRVLEIFGNLGGLYRSQGKIAEAEKLFVRALQGFEKAFGPNDTSALKAVGNLGNLYQNQGKMAAAEKMYVWALRGLEKALGPEHTSTLDTANNLAALYQDQGKIAEAEEMSVRALRGYEKIWGPEHRLTLRTIKYLGILYRDHGKMTEAEEMFKRALRGYEKARGPEHISTLDIANRLSDLYRAQGKMAEAEEMYLRVLRGKAKALYEGGNTALQVAAIQGDEATVKLLLENEAEIDGRDGEGLTALHYAVENGLEAITRLLLEKGAAIDGRDKEGRTALYRAALNGHEAVVQLLLENGAEVDGRDEGGHTALQAAVFQGHEAVVELLLEKGAKIDRRDELGLTALETAVICGQKMVVWLLLKKGAAVDGVNNKGEAMLQMAAGNGHEAVVQVLLENGAVIDRRDPAGGTALLSAAVKGHEAVVRLLLNKGASLDTSAGGRWPALCVAAIGGHEGVAALLLEKGAKINEGEDAGGTALQIAAGEGHKAVMQLLLEKGAAVNARDNTGHTALHYAAIHGYENLVQRLLKNGPAVGGRDEEGDGAGGTGLQIKAAEEHKAVAQLLLEKGAAVNARDNTGHTALHYAAIHGHENLVQLLLEKGAEVDVEEAAPHIAAVKGHKAAVQLLLEKRAGPAVEKETTNSNGVELTQLPDYTDEQLQEILVDMIHKEFEDSTVEVQGGFDGPHMQAFISMIGRGRGKPSFRNAETLQKCFSKLCDRREKRLRREEQDDVFEEPNHILFTKTDLLGESAAEMASRSKSWKTLQSMVGLERVKTSVEALFGQVVVNHRRELQGKKPIKITLNRCFLGPPGTGKTTAAKLYAQILIDLGLISESEVVTKAASDLIGKYIGHSEAKTKEALDRAKNGVLVIDDAHILVPGATHDSSHHTDVYRAAIIDALVANMQPDPDEGQAVILIGYPDAMYELIERSNPGLARRFPLEEAFHFPAFSEDQLQQILEYQLLRDDLEATPQAKEVAREMLSMARHRPNFGNGGHVENLLGRAKVRYQARVSLMDTSDEAEPLLEPYDFDPDYARAMHARERCDELFRDMQGCDYIVAQFQRYQDTFAHLKIRGHDPRPFIPLTFVFKGPPGTGKTTVARKVGQIFYDMGFLANPELIECSVSHLISGHVSQIGQNVIRLFERALGKVLFIDEAYRLGEKGAVNAIGEIVDCVTKKRFARKMIIILAGYEDDMNRLLQLNRGLRSRFSNDVIFHPMRPADCLELLMKLVGKLDVQIDGLQPTNLSRQHVLYILSRLAGTKSWANGRDVEALAQKVIEYAFIHKATGSGVMSKIIIHADELVELLKIRLARARKEDTGMAGNYPTAENDDWVAMNLHMRIHFSPMGRLKKRYIPSAIQMIQKQNFARSDQMLSPVTWQISHISMPIQNTLRSVC